MYTNRLHSFQFISLLILKHFHPLQSYLREPVLAVSTVFHCVQAFQNEKDKQPKHCHKIRYLVLDILLTSIIALLSVLNHVLEFYLQQISCIVVSGMRNVYSLTILGEWWKQTMTSECYFTSFNFSIHHNDGCLSNSVPLLQYWQ